MTPKEEAIELLKKFENVCVYSNLDYIEYIGFIPAKECAIILIDEVLNEITQYEFGHPILVSKSVEYWKKVKIEIEKL